MKCARCGSVIQIEVGQRCPICQEILKPNRANAKLIEQAERQLEEIRQRQIEPRKKKSRLAGFILAVIGGGILFPLYIEDRDLLRERIERYITCIPLSFLGGLGIALAIIYYLVWVFKDMGCALIGDLD